MSNFLSGILQAVALAAVLGASHAPAILPTRRRAFESGYDLNRHLPDPGKAVERLLRKQARKQRLHDLQAQAAKGGRA
jgi:hypothetical protein